MQYQFSVSVSLTVSDYVEMGGNSVHSTVQTTDETLKIYETVVVDVQL